MSNKVRTRRVVQIVSLLIFLLCLAIIGLNSTESYLSRMFSVFLIIDPLSALVSSVAARDLVVCLFLPLSLVALTLIFGRFFCGYICPMGTTIDIIDSFTGTDNRNYPGLRPMRYILLFAVITAALLGVNLAFHLLPISLATRFYGLVLYPALRVMGAEGVGFGQSALGLFGYFEIADRHYASIFFISLIFLGLFIISRYSKRFWCRYICPTGALLGLLSVFSLNKRAVNSNCVKCGLCQKGCPTCCIQNIIEYNHQDCLACKKCADICPAQAVSFSVKIDRTPSRPTDLSRRELMKGAALGGALAILSMNELKALLNINTEHGALIYEGLLRPPGSLPEKEFLAKCVRCGQCMAACPTNGLQPLWLQSGSAAVFSPVLVPLKGPCEVNCRRCGTVCPTGAIKELPLEEKQHAKIGTARIRRERCLAWEENRACMVCHEVCPYNAMRLTPEPGHKVTVPRIDQNRCFGCGACEHSCPLEVPAVVVEPIRAVRLKTANYVERSGELSLELKVSGDQTVFGGGADSGLPPGFTE